MLVQVFPKLKNFFPVKLLRAFFSSALYFVLIGLLMTLGELFAIELAVFWCDFILGALVLFLADDALATVPIACCGYMAIAAKNNNIHGAGEGRPTIFRDPSFQFQLFFILLLAVVLHIARLIMLLIEDPRRAGAPKLSLGFLLLGGAYMLSGGFSAHYTGRTAFFGFVQIASLAFFYFYYHYAVNWERTPKWYAPALFTCIGMFIAVQIAGMYTNEGVFTASGTVNRGGLYTGWGTYNNVGCIMAMCIPAPCYFAATRKHGWIFTMIATFFLLATMLTQSRGSMIFGAVTYAACSVWALIGSRGAERRNNIILYLAVLAAVAIVFVVFREKLDALFASIIKAGMDDSSRFDIWRNCWDAFRKNPVFGVGWYDTPGFGFEYNANHAAFMPGRAHNTYFQLLATGGTVLVLAYLFHRIQTLWLLLRRPSHLKFFALFVVVALVLTSVVDCHFFNIGPGILYGIVLVFAEGSERKREPRLKAFSKKRPVFSL